MYLNSIVFVVVVVVVVVVVERRRRATFQGTAWRMGAPTSTPADEAVLRCSRVGTLTGQKFVPGFLNKLVIHDNNPFSHCT